MCIKPSTQPASKETIIPIVPIAVEEQPRRVEQAIAKRAYQIFEKRGGTAWHELEDWRQAEGELHGNLSLSEITGDHTVVIGTDPGGFAHGTLEIWAASTRLTLSGEWQPRRPIPATGGSYPPFHHIYRSIERHVHSARHVRRNGNRRSRLAAQEDSRVGDPIGVQRV
jgi:hypothetical protein